MADECKSTVGIEEIDDPSKIEETQKLREGSKIEFPISKTVRKWVKEHGDVIDECKNLIRLKNSNNHLFFSNNNCWSSVY